MVSKAEARRRRLTRGLDTSGISPSPSEKVKQSQCKTSGEKPVTLREDKDELSTTPVATEMLATKSNSSLKYSGAEKEARSRSFLANYHPVVEGDVMIFYKVVMTVADGSSSVHEEHIMTVDADRLHALSQRFCDELPSLAKHQQNGKDVYTWVIGESAASKRAVFEYFKWLKTVWIPFPATFNGIKQMYPDPSWDHHAWAALFRFSQWLDLKHPFDNPVFYGKCRDYIMDSNEYECMVVIDIWNGCKKRQERLKRVILDRTVDWVEQYDDRNPLDAFYRPEHHAWVENMEKFAPPMAKAFLEREIELGNWRARKAKQHARNVSRGYQQ